MTQETTSTKKQRLPHRLVRRPSWLGSGGLALIASAVFTGCIGMSPDDQPEVTRSYEDDIQSGQLETGFRAVGRYKNDRITCTATLISASFVLTTRTCSGSSPRFEIGTSPSNFVSYVIDREIKHPTKNLMLAHLRSPILDVPLQSFNSGELPAVGTICTGVGFGTHVEPNGTTTSGIKRSCTEEIELADARNINVVMLSGIADWGDWGGPLLCNGKIAAIDQGHIDGNFPQHIRETYATVDAKWILRQIGFVPAPADYDHDGKADLGGRDADGNWYVDHAANGFGQWDVIRPRSYGGPTCIPVPADYNGDGYADFSVKCPEANPDGSIGTWLIDYANTAPGWDVRRTGYGGKTCVPVPADYDGDGKADFSVKCPETNPDGSVGIWLVDYAGTPENGWDVERTGYGRAACIPVPADYDGDRKADFSVKCPEDYGTWFVDYASSPQDGWNVIRTGYGGSTCMPVPADYDGDGKADFSSRCPETNPDGSIGTWFVDYASSPQDGWNVIRTGYGDATMTAVPADYDGDRKADFSIEGFATWFIDFASSPQDGWNQIVTLP